MVLPSEISPLIRADTDETVAVAVHYGLGTRRLYGPRFSADLKLGTNPALSLDFAHKFQKGLPSIGVDLRSRLINTTCGWANSTEERLLNLASDLYLEDARMRFGSMRLGLTAEMDPYERYLEYGETWQGWDWKSYWLSAFANLKVDTFDDGYFPTRGIRFSLKGRYVFKGYSIDLDPRYLYIPDPENMPTNTGDGHVPSYVTSMAAIEGAIPLGSHFTVLPKFYAGFYRPFIDNLWQYDPDDYLNPHHLVTMGGFMQDRYTENQIPFFLCPTGYQNTALISTVAQVDLRYCFARKNFVTARGGCFIRTDELAYFFYDRSLWGVGLEYARQSMIGPLRVAGQWSPILGFSLYASIGFDF